MLVQTFVPPVLIVVAIVILARGRGGSEMQVIDRMLKRIDDLENKTTMSLAWAMRLSQQVVELGGKPINYADIERTQNGLISSMSEDPSRLLQLLRDRFTIDEIEMLAFELGAKEGALGAGNVDSRALKLVRFAQTHSKLDRLALIAWRQRPDLMEAEGQ